MLSFWIATICNADQETKTYPVEFKPRPAKIQVVAPPDKSAFAWQTDHFLLLSDREIQGDLIRRFATTIESIPGVLENHPLPLWSPLGDRRPVIRLCNDEERFAEFGGPAGSAGIYDGSKNEVLIRADLFLNPPGSSTRLKEPPDEDILVHEVCHLVMAGTLRPSKPWVKEGLAEYFSTAHQRGGHHRFDRFTSSIPKHVQRRLALKPADVVELPSLSEVIQLSTKDWNEQLEESAPEEGYLPYATSLLLVHYNLEGDRRRREEFAEFIEELKAYRPRRSKRPVFSIADPKLIEERLVNYWSSRGLKLRFKPFKGTSKVEPTS